MEILSKKKFFTVQGVENKSLQSIMSVALVERALFNVHSVGTSIMRNQMPIYAMSVAFLDMPSLNFNSRLNKDLQLRRLKMKSKRI